MNPDVPALVDAAAPEPVLVFGSPPPDGRDLDLLVRPGAEAALAAALGEAGFVRRGRSWARFGAGTADVVDLVPAGSWAGVPVDEVYAAAEPVPGYLRIVQPAAHHRLLVLVRRARHGMTPKVRERLAAVPASAWPAARAEAARWGLADVLRRIEDGSLPDARPGRSRRGAVVAVSGLDGSGKSSQAAALADALRAAGVDAVVEWRRLSQDSSLDRLAVPVKRLLRRLLRRGSTSTAPVAYSRTERDAASHLRQRSRAATWAWALVVAAVHARSQRAAVRPHLRAGRVVVCDRYTLDSLVNLRFRYGVGGLPALVVRAVVPRARRAYLLDIPPEESLRRKDDGYAPEQLARQHALYAELVGRLGVRRVDGARRFDEIARELAADVWAAL